MCGYWHKIPVYKCMCVIVASLQCKYFFLTNAYEPDIWLKDLLLYYTLKYIHVFLCLLVFFYTSFLPLYGLGLHTGGLVRL